MKQIFLAMFAAAALLVGMTGCSSVDNPSSNNVISENVEPTGKAPWVLGADCHPTIGTQTSEYASPAEPTYNFLKKTVVANGNGDCNCLMLFVLSITAIGRHQFIQCLG